MEVQESNPRTGLSPMQAAERLKQLRNPPQEQAEEPIQEQETDNQVEGEEIEAEADTETETPEVEEDQAEEEVQEEAEPSDEDVYQVGDLEFTLAELREWRDNGMKNADYTQKTQALSQERTALATERQQFEVERSQVTEQLRAQQLQLQESLASFAIEQDPRPDPEGKSWEQHSKELAAWEKREAKRLEAKRAFQSLQAQKAQETVSRELQQLLMKRPEWRDQDTWTRNMSEAQAVAADYGISSEEFETLTDHRVFMALHDLHQMRQGMTSQQAKESAAAKKVVKAVKKLGASAKPDQKTGVQKQAQQATAQLRKSGKPKDALAALKARRAAGG